MNREHLMSRWDAWRKYIAEGGKGSWPRDEFEMLLDYFMVPCAYWDVCGFMYEDELPEDLPQEIYDWWFNNSKVDGVRIGPIMRDCKDCPHGGSNEL